MSDETNQSDTTEAIICIDPKDFDPSRVVIHDPLQNEFKVGGMTIKTTTSAGRYLNDDGVECMLFIKGPPQRTFGFSYTWEMNVKEEDRSPENAKGVQVCYPLTSLQTFQEPTPHEQDFKTCVLALWQATVDKGREELEKEESLLPQASLNSFTAASKKGQWERAVKMPFSHPKLKDDKKNFDTSKPETMYTKLATTGRGETMKVNTLVYGPGDRKQNALRYIDTPGILEPVFLWEGAYHGAHGSEAPHGTSLRFKLAQCNFTPKAYSSIPQNRMLGRNTAPVEEEDTFPAPRGLKPDVDEGAEDDTFAGPGEDAVDPATALAIVTKKQPAKTGKAPAKAKAVPAKGGSKAPAKPKAAPAPTKGTAKPKAKPAPVKAKPAPKKVIEPEEDVVEDEVEE